jgi:hypothetical protein
VTDRSATSGSAGSSRSDSADGVSTLDRRREKMQARKGAGEATAADVVSVDDQLAANASQRREHEAALQAALDAVAVLKKSIKASTKERNKLRSARKGARRVAAKAQQRTDTAEAKYDRAVLADMLRREKDNDLSEHTDENNGKAGKANTSGRASAAPRSRASTSRAGTSRAGTSRAGTSRAGTSRQGVKGKARKAAAAKKPGA